MKIYNFTFPDFKTSLILISLFFWGSGCQNQPAQNNQTNVEKVLNDPQISSSANKDQILGHDLSSDGKMLLTGSFDKAVSLWDVSTKKLIHRFHGHEKFVFVTSLSFDGRMAASCDNKSIKIWDVVNKKEIKTLEGNAETINSLTFSRDNKLLISTSRDKSIIFWDISTGKQKQIISVQGVKPVAVSPNGKLIAFTGTDESIKLWDVEIGKELASLKGHSYPASVLNFSPDGKTLLSGSSDKTLKLWQINEGKEIQSFNQADAMRDIAFSPDGKKIAASSFEIIKVWDIASGKELLSLPGKTGWFVQIGFSLNGKTLVGVSENKDFFIWDAESGKKLN